MEVIHDINEVMKTHKETNSHHDMNGTEQCTVYTLSMAILHNAGQIVTTCDVNPTTAVVNPA